MTRNKHLMPADRLEIEHGLRHGLSIRKIASKIGKHPSTIAREIRARSVPSDKGAFGRVTNRCVSRRVCDRRQLCEHRPDCGRAVGLSSLNSVCPDSRGDCAKLATPPYVVMDAAEAQCVLRKRHYLYRPLKQATVISCARQGANITEGNSRARRARQPLDRRAVRHHILNHPTASTSMKTVYRYIGRLAARQKRGHVARLLAQAQIPKTIEHKIDTAPPDELSRLPGVHGRDTDRRVVEMIPRTIGGKVPSRSCSETATSCSPSSAITTTRSPHRLLCPLVVVGRSDLFRRLFPVLLTDNGPEFSNPARWNAPRRRHAHAPVLLRSLRLRKAPRATTSWYA